MKNVYLRNGGYWFARMSNKTRVWVNLETRDYGDAVKKTLEIRNNPMVVTKKSVEGDVRRFVDYKLRMDQFSRDSAANKFYPLRDFANWLPESATLSNITGKQVAGFYAHLQTSVTESTAQGYMVTLRSFFRWAMDVERARIDNPVKSLKMAKCDRRGRLAWCDRDLKNKLLLAAKSDDLRFFLYCGFDAGLRLGEIIEARRDWFDLNAKLLHIRRADGPPRLRGNEVPFRPKDRDERSIPLTDPFCQFLKKYLKKHAPLDFALKPEVLHHKSRYRYDYRRPFTNFMKKQECEWITPHVMRHSFASILASAGISIFKIAEWLGDGVNVVQRHYAKLAPGDNDIHALTSSG